VVTSETPAAPLDWLIVCPMGLERRAVAKALSERCALRKCGRNFWQASLGAANLGLLQCGIGTERAEAETARVLQSRSVRRLLLIGLGGGLAEELAVGNAVVASRVVLENGDTLGDFLLPGLLPGIAVTRSLVCVSHPICSTADKRGLARSSGAAVVDMESAGVFRAAAAVDLPMIAIRVISDDAETSLPPDVAGLLKPNGEIHSLSALRLAFLPHLWGKLRSLQRGSHRAVRTLERIVCEFDWQSSAESFERTSRPE